MLVLEDKKVVIVKEEEGAEVVSVLGLEDSGDSEGGGRAEVVSVLVLEDKEVVNVWVVWG